MAFAFFELPARPKVKPGYTQVWFAPNYDFNVIQEAITPGVLAGDTVTIEDTHTFLTGKGFFPLPVLGKLTKIDGESGGDPGSATESWKGEFFIAGDDADLLELATQIINVEGILLFKDSDCANPEYMQLGCECLGAVIKYKYTSGTVKDGQKGFTFTAEADCIPNKYTGTITEHP